MKTAYIMVLGLLLATATAFAQRTQTRDFQTRAGQNAQAWPITFVQGKSYNVVASVRPAGWDPGGSVARAVPIRLVIFLPNGRQMSDTGARGGTASQTFRAPVTGQYEVQAIIAAPLGALGRLQITEY